MNKKIIEALLQLFAIIAKVEVNENESDTEYRRGIVRDFLEQQLSRELVTNYLRVYDDFVEGSKASKSGNAFRKKTSLNSVKVLKICLLEPGILSEFIEIVQFNS